MRENRVFVLDRNLKPLMPCHPARARRLLKTGRAAIWRRSPFTIVLKDRTGGQVQAVRLKLDPGSRTTGMALAAAFARRGGTVIWAGELHHRGHQIRAALVRRRALRRGRRYRKTRYRPPRFDNRRRPEGWLAPSLQHRVDTALTWVGRLCRFAPVTDLSLELVRFDTQKLQNPEVSGTEYQQGELFGYEVREYLLEKWGRRCAYCDAENVPLEVDHIVPHSRGGSDRVSNLTLACRDCNQAKGNRDVREFLARDPERLERVLRQCKTPLQDAAAVNAIRWALYRALVATGLPVEAATGGRTKWNRTRRRYPKAHWIDAACVGESGSRVRLDPDMKPLAITATGRGARQVVKTDRYGFPRTAAGRIKRVQGFQTGDLVKLVQPKGKYAGVHVGRLAGVRADGRFDLKCARGKITAPWSRFTLLQRADGYAYG